MRSLAATYRTLLAKADAPATGPTLARVKEPNAPHPQQPAGASAHARVEILDGHPRHHAQDYLVPHASVAHHLDEMHGRVTGTPDHHSEHVNNVVSGRAQHIGRGNDGMVFKSGDKAVKVGGVTPFHPHVTGAYRTPEHAAARTKESGERAEHLRNLGVPGIPKTDVHHHAGRTFLVRDWMHKPDSLTREDLDHVQRSVIGVHKHGYALNDRIQVARGKDGHLYHYDLEAVTHARHDSQGSSLRNRHPDFDNDHQRLQDLYRHHGHDFEPLGGYMLARSLEDHSDLGFLHGLHEGDSDAHPVEQHEKRLHHLVRHAIRDAHENLTGPHLHERLGEIERHRADWHENVAYGREIKAKHNARKQQ
jgi:hypothetical protein